MKQVKSIIIRFAAAILPLAWAFACQPASPEDFFSGSRSADQLVQVQMALSLQPGAALPATKMTDAVTQSEANTDYTVFRGIEQMFIIPFGSFDKVTASDERIGKNLQLPHLGISPVFGTTAADGNLAGLVENNNSHLYQGVYFKIGTSAALAYGKAIDESVAATPSDSINYKRRNGVLRGNGLASAASPAEISFSLEPFINSGNEAAMQSTLNGILAYLTDIAGAAVSYTGYTYRSRTQTTWRYYWDDAASYSNFPTLVSAFETLTGGGNVFSGGTESLEGMLTSIYNGLYDIATDEYESSSYTQEYYEYNSYYSSGDYYYVYQLAREIRSLIDNSSYVTLSGSGSNVSVSFNSTYSGFPGGYGVPDGAVAIQWNGNAFTQVSAASSALAPIDAYCYPPSLWYWTNSRLVTSDEENVDDEYVSSNPDWATILGHYTLGRTVKPGATSAAIEEPLQYGVAMLELEMNASSSEGGTSNLLDSNANTVDITGNVFPLIGIIVGEQRDQHFNFTPSSGSNYYVYDAEVLDGTSPKAYIRYNNSGFKKIHTLMVQTDVNEDVHYALEFRNDSGAPFYGVNGCTVPAGGKFYLIGTLEISKMTDAQKNGIECVFTQDHITRVSASVRSLAKAYNTIPELRDPQLEIGVQTEMKWVGSTPAEIPMY